MRNVQHKDNTNRMTPEVARNSHCSAQRNDSESGCHVAEGVERTSLVVAAAGVLGAHAALQADKMQHELKHER